LPFGCFASRTAVAGRYGLETGRGRSPKDERKLELEVELPKWLGRCVVEWSPSYMIAGV